MTESPPLVTADDIRRLLARRRWSQVDLARVLGVDKQTVHRWVAGQRTPTPVMAHRLVELLTEPDRPSRDLTEPDRPSRDLVSATAEAFAADPEPPEVTTAGMTAMNAGFAAGLTPTQAWVLGDAARAHAAGTTASAWIGDRRDISRWGDDANAYLARTEDAIAAIQTAGLWPWEGGR